MKYQELEGYMLQELSCGRFALEDRFFSELDIARQFEVNHVTARKAFDALVRKGYIVRRRGAGTFVKRLPECPQQLRMLKRCVIGIATGRSDVDNSLKLGRMLIRLHRTIEAAGYLSMLVGEDLTPLEEAGACGLIVLDRVDDGFLRRLLQGGIPVVGVYPDSGLLAGLSFNYSEAAERIVALFKERKLRHLALVGEGDDALTVRNMFEKPLTVAAQRQDLAFSIAVPPVGSVVSQLESLLDAKCPPDALFVANAWSLGSIAPVLAQRRLAVGRDISILVHGSNALLIPGTPAYALIDWDMDHVVEQAVAMLQSLIRNPQQTPAPASVNYGAILERGSIVPAGE
ncbi:GntR family transcriptional regulator [Victivallis sp. Marseille-Q1083]|uniref:GntR family transcriptional regulator n=1 Tax=Victivallis sp. Marseille-Q1083 TaxID=2717288 RepID=UPI0015897619|nr:GntR family transcriptional regulator [Victivallis sp. Marseille-Q1083]